MLTTKRFVRRGLVTLFLFFIAQSVSSATIYLSPDGNDSDDGSSWALAKKTLAGALSAAGSGDVILATNGTYTSTHFAIDWVRSGETLRSVNGPDYTAITPYDTMMPCIRLEGTLDGFTVKNGDTSSSYKGGGVMLIGGTLMNSIVTNNNSDGGGGGVYVDSGGLVSNCVVSGNSASADGGGVYLRNGQVTDTTISENTAGTKGGGVFVSSSSGLIENSMIRKNVAAGDGGGFYGASSGEIRGCLLSGNESGGNGGGIHFDGSTVESCTVVGNTATGNGSGVYATFGGSRLRNTIAYYNETDDAYMSASAYMDNCCLQTVLNKSISELSITNAPLFTQAGSGYGTNHVSGSYLLKPTSPCIDTGVNQAWMANTTDLAGTNRIINAIVNMGAYEAIGSGLEAQTITFAEIPAQDKSSVLTLAATASSGLTVSYVVNSGPAVLNGTTLSFSGVGFVSITASQAGNDTYDPAPDVTRTFGVFGSETFTLKAVALTNSVILRWPDPYECGYSNRTVALRYSTATYPSNTVDGSSLYTGTNKVYQHTNLQPDQTIYYTIFTSQDGSTFVTP